MNRIPILNSGGMLMIKLDMVTTKTAFAKFILAAIASVFFAYITHLIWGDSYAEHYLHTVVFALTGQISYHFFSWLLPQKNRLWHLFFSLITTLFIGISHVVWWNNIGSDDLASLAKIMLVSLLFCIIIYYFFFSQEQARKMQVKLHQAELKQTQIQHAATQSQLQLLQSQIEPHFLFNTLANLQALIRQDPIMAEKLLNKLTELLRSSLKKSRAAEITLEDELSSLEAYLEIQKIRLGTRLKFNIHRHEKIKLSSKLPPLLLQPLVENAVLHGIEPKIEGGSITVSVNQINGKLNIQIIDTGIGLQSNNSKQQGHGFALNNIRQRLNALFGQQASLTIKNNRDNGVTATMELPCEL